MVMGITGFLLSNGGAEYGVGLKDWKVGGIAGREDTQCVCIGQWRAGVGSDRTASDMHASSPLRRILP